MRHGSFALFLLLLSVLYVWLNAYDGVGSLKGDGMIYLNTARHYAPYGPDDVVAAAAAEVTQFPPLYSALLAVTGGASDFGLAHGLTTICLLLAFAAVYAWLITLRVAPLRAGLATALFAIAPGTFLQSFYLHPEGLYVTLSFAALFWLGRAEQASRPLWLWAASAAIAAAILARTIGVTLLPAFLAVLLRNRPARWPGMVALAVVPAILWGLVHDPPWSYSDTMKAQYLDAPFAAILAGLWASIASAGTGLAGNVLSPGHLVPGVVLLGVVAAGAALWRFFHGCVDAWYLMAYVAVLALWPYPQEAPRLTWVVVPIVLGYVVWVGELLAARTPLALARMRPVLAWAPVVVLALMIVPEFALLAARAVHPLARANPVYRHFPQWYQPEIREARWQTEIQIGTAAGLQRFATQIPATDCAFSTLPVLAMFYTRRPMNFPPPEAMDDRAFEDWVRRIGCRYFVFLTIGARADETAFYPFDRVRDRIRVLDEQRVGPGDGGPLVAILGVLKPGWPAQ